MSERQYGAEPLSYLGLRQKVPLESLFESGTLGLVVSSRALILAVASGAPRGADDSRGGEEDSKSCRSQCTVS